MTKELHKYKCDVCNQEMTTHTVGYLGKSLNNTNEDKLESLCYTHYIKRLNDLGINPNTLHSNDLRSSHFGTSFGMGF